MTIGQVSEAVRICLDEAAREGRRDRHLEAQVAAARGERAALAKSLRETLPEFVRTAPPEALEERIGRPELLAFARLPNRASCLILGPTGVGKTVAAALAFRRVLGAGVRHAGPAWDFAATARWYDASALARARRGWPLGQGDPPEFERAAGASILFLDDLGQERQDDGSLRDVLNERYSNARPTVVTTGLRMPELVTRYDAQFVRRILQGGTILDVFPKE